MATRFGGTVSQSAFAVLRWITNSIFVTCCTPRERQLPGDNQAGTDMSAGLSPRGSNPELVGEVVEVLAHDIERPLRFGFASTRTAFPRPPNMAGA
jgi:hypothetical protein